MKSARIFASLGVLATLTSIAAVAVAEVQPPRTQACVADDCRQDERTPAQLPRGHDRGMKEVPAQAGPGEPGHGWRYFADTEARRAVVISPQGEYFLSSGKGLHLVSVTQPGF